MALTDVVLPAIGAVDDSVELALQVPPAEGHGEVDEHDGREHPPAVDDPDVGDDANHAQGRRGEGDEEADASVV